MKPYPECWKRIGEEIFLKRKVFGRLWSCVRFLFLLPFHGHNFSIFLAVGFISPFRSSAQRPTSVSKWRWSGEREGEEERFFIGIVIKEKDLWLRNYYANKNLEGGISASWWTLFPLQLEKISWEREFTLRSEFLQHLHVGSSIILFHNWADRKCWMVKRMKLSLVNIIFGFCRDNFIVFLWIHSSSKCFIVSWVNSV